MGISGASQRLCKTEEPNQYNVLFVCHIFLALGWLKKHPDLGKP